MIDVEKNLKHHFSYKYNRFKVSQINSEFILKRKFKLKMKIKNFVLSIFAFYAATSEAVTTIKPLSPPGSPVVLNLKDYVSYVLMKQVAQSGLIQSTECKNYKNYNLTINYASVKSFPN